MKTMVDEWRESARQIEDHSGALAAEAWFELAAELESACTPRPPKREWFEKWDSWWFGWNDGSSDLCRSARWGTDFITGVDCEGYHTKWTVPPDMVVPVAREGFPAAVGWRVVEK